MWVKVVSSFCLVFLLSGCWNGENVHVRLGDVSMGQQLVDLKTAHDQGALTEDEYEDSKERLLAFYGFCKDNDSDNGWF